MGLTHPSKEYFDLLKGISSRLFKLHNKTLNDSVLLGRIKTEVLDANPLEYCFLYDLVGMTRIISGADIGPKSIEIFALLLMVSTWNQTEDGIDLFDLGYEVVSIEFENGRFDTTSKGFLQILEKGNPLKWGGILKEDGQLSTAETHDVVLVIPGLLKLMGHPLFDEYATILYQFATIIAKADGVLSAEEQVRLQTVYSLLHDPLPNKLTGAAAFIANDDQESLEEVLAELDILIGLENVKQEVRTLVNFIKIQKERGKAGLKTSPISYHCVFTGSPGTGKTTIARIVAKLYLHLGILQKGHLVETDRSGLVAEYTGQTAVKTNKIIDSAINGVLFIDEAYSVVGENQDDFGKEAIATLIKRMEDDRDKLVVIVAGYTKEMGKFMKSNPGFKSRFNRYIDFADYSPLELEEIFLSRCKSVDYSLVDGAKEELRKVINVAFQAKDNSFGNARFVRNLFEKTLEKQANRLAGLASVTKEILITIIRDDIAD